MKKIIVLFSLLLTSCLFSSANAADANFLILSDVHYLKGGPVVDYGKGDSGDVLWRNTQAQLQQEISQTHAQFMLLLGDLPAHDDASRTTNIQAVLQDLSATVNIPVFYVPGNNDSLGNDLMAGDYHSFSNNKGQNPLSLDAKHAWPALNANQACDTLSDTHRACLINPKDAALAQFGFYAARPLGSAAKLRLIVLNSVIFSARYVSDDGVSQEKATTDELAWFKAQLAQASTAGDEVFVALHIPPGLDAYSDTPMWNDALPAEADFITAMNDYQTIIKGVFYGHTHMDEFRRLNNTLGSLAVLALSTPGITPGHYNSPAIKAFSYDDSFALTDAQTIYTNPLDSTHWFSYGFKAIYHCTKATLFQCATDFSVQDDTFVTTYKAHYAVNNAAFQPNYWSNIVDAIDVGADSITHHPTRKVFFQWPIMF